MTCRCPSLLITSYRSMICGKGTSSRGRRSGSEFPADGPTAAAPDGTIAYIPWPVFTAVRETRERFFLFKRRYKEVWVLPKRALSDQSSVRQLGEFLRASVGREAAPT